MNKYLNILLIAMTFAVVVFYTIKVGDSISELKLNRIEQFEIVNSQLNELDIKYDSLQSRISRIIGDTSAKLIILNPDNRKFSFSNVKQVHSAVVNTNEKSFDILYGNDSITKFSDYQSFIRFIDSISYSSVWVDNKTYSKASDDVSIYLNDSIIMGDLTIKPKLKLYDSNTSRNYAIVKEMENGVDISGSYTIPKNSYLSESKISFTITYINNAGITSTVGHFEENIIPNKKGEKISFRKGQLILDKVGKGVFLLTAYYKGQAIGHSNINVL